MPSKKEGNSMFINPSIENIQNNQSNNGSPGFIEQSNVNAIQEMAELN